MEKGFRRAGWEVDLCPAADGGDGTLETLTDALGGELIAVEAHDPLGRKSEAAFSFASDESTAVIEMAKASGISLVDERERDAEAASSYGTGELICEAVAKGAHKILIGVGGSATTDGGEGALRAIEDAGGLHGAHLTVLCDVRTPWEQAAPVYAPQKGASVAAVARLAKRLDVMANKLPKDPRGVPMTGCAGGLSGGLWAAHNANLVPGASWILNTLNFDKRMRASRAIITGEGELDRQSLSGKLLGEAATRARQAGVPSYAIVAEDSLNQFDKRILDLQEVHIAKTLRQIETAAETIGHNLGP
jgi:glycerate kinase